MGEQSEIETRSAKLGNDIETAHTRALAWNDLIDTADERERAAHKHYVSIIPQGARGHWKAIKYLHAEALGEDAYRTALKTELRKFAEGEPPYPYPVTATVRIPARGQTTVVVTPPAPCGLGTCVGELHVSTGSDLPSRVHLDDAQRRALVKALGGVMPR